MGSEFPIVKCAAAVAGAAIAVCAFLRSSSQRNRAGQAKRGVRASTEPTPGKPPATEQSRTTASGEGLQAGGESGAIGMLTAGLMRVICVKSGTLRPCKAPVRGPLRARSRVRPSTCVVWAPGIASLLEASERVDAPSFTPTAAADESGQAPAARAAALPPCLSERSVPDEQLLVGQGLVRRSLDPFDVDVGPATGVGDRSLPLATVQRAVGDKLQVSKRGLAGHKEPPCRCPGDPLSVPLEGSKATGNGMEDVAPHGLDAHLVEGQGACGASESLNPAVWEGAKFLRRATTRGTTEH
eukprot:evm.model.scf_447EXC.3 EVM.evm.TU.scf_447EXC.3   scf_447EXC:21267-22263(+)